MFKKMLYCIWEGGGAKDFLESNFISVCSEKKKLNKPVSNMWNICFELIIVNCDRDAIITVIINYLSSFISGAVIFMYLGYMSQVANKDITEVAKDGNVTTIACHELQTT